MNEKLLGNAKRHTGGDGHNVNNYRLLFVTGASVNVIFLFFFCSLTNRVVTLWFRSPELLLGDCDYGTAVDLWGFGCVMAEMWTRYSLFQGVSEQTQLTTICELCGSITPDVWPDVVKLYLYGMLNLPVGIPRKVR